MEADQSLSVVSRGVEVVLADGVQHQHVEGIGRVELVVEAPVDARAVGAGNREGEERIGDTASTLSLQTRPSAWA